MDCTASQGSRIGHAFYWPNRLKVLAATTRREPRELGYAYNSLGMMASKRHREEGELNLREAAHFR